MDLLKWNSDLRVYNTFTKFPKNRREQLEKKWSEEEKQLSRSESKSIFSILDNITLTEQQEINFIGTSRIVLDFNFSRDNFLSFCKDRHMNQFFVYFRNKTCWEKRKAFISSVCFLENGAKARMLFTQDTPPGINIFTQN